MSGPATDLPTAPPEALAALCPDAPGWTLHWDAAVVTLPPLARLGSCPQDPVHHAEGDVGTHTRMTCEALVGMPAWRSLPETERVQVLTAALLHDIAKPECTRVKADGRVSAHGHAGRGERATRRLLWELGVPPSWREHVAQLVRHHQVPFWAFERADPERLALEVSHTTRCDHLVLLARADLAGRICSDRDEILDRVDLFQALCEELGCWRAPYPFTSDHARFSYFRTPGRDPAWPAFDDTRADVLLLSGLPASGKDTWLRTDGPDWPVVDLDALRSDLGVDPRGAQRAVVAAARSLAREHLREGRPFVWNATNLSRRLRRGMIEVFHAYRARVHIVCTEAGEDAVRERNRARVRPVPDTAIGRMLQIWEAPDRTEAHRLTRVHSGTAGSGSHR